MVRFICDSCKNEKMQDIECHGHKIHYNNMGYFVCSDCSDRQLSDKELEECIPECCYRPMRPVGG